MFSHFFGNYLISKEKLTKQQFREILLFQKTARVKLGLIAVASDLLTKAQADEINHIQAKIDKRFGDIAVEKGYLTQEQVGFLLKQQGSPYMAFTQAAVEKGFLSIEDVNQMICEYQREYEISDATLSSMKDGDTDAFAKQFIQIDKPLFFEHFSLFLRNIIRFIQPDIYFDSAYCVDTYEFDTLASQTLSGLHQITVGIAGCKDALLEVANPYADEQFETVDEDAFDSVCEFINCVNGLFARTLYERGIEEDMLPPLFYTKQTVVSSGALYVLPVYINEKQIDILLSVDENISFK